MTEKDSQTDDASENSESNGSAPEASPTDSGESATGADGEATEPPTPEARIEALEKEKEEFRDRMLRVAADFENWKRRARKDLGDAQFKAKESVLRDMLEVADNLERAVASSGSNEAAKPIVDGVGLVLRLFQQKLERHDVKAIEAKGQPFDPRLHEALSRQPTTDVPAGSVVEELVRGYTMGDRLLRASSVVVAVAPPEPAADGAHGQGDGGGEGGDPNGGAA